MGGVDAIVFTAGLGENSPETREEVCKGLEFIGVKIDNEKNCQRGKQIDISAEGAVVRTFIIPTNEELMIAKDTRDIVSAL